MYEKDPARFSDGEMTMFGYITELDDAVGSIIRKLQSTNAEDNTIIIFSSDNGAPPASDDVNHKVNKPDGAGYIARNHPFRGWKTQIWEGGTRVSGFVSSPLLPAAVRSHRCVQPTRSHAPLSRAKRARTPAHPSLLATDSKPVCLALAASLFLAAPSLLLSLSLPPPSLFFSSLSLSLSLFAALVPF